MNNFSPNMLKTFDECQMKFFFKYIEKISVPQRAKLFEKGKKVHALANYYLKGSDISKMEKVLNLDERAAWEALKASEYFKLKVVNTEYNLSCKVDKYWIGGRLDALMCSEAYAGGHPTTLKHREREKTLTIQPFNHSTFQPLAILYSTTKLAEFLKMLNGIFKQLFICFRLINS